MKITKSIVNRVEIAEGELAEILAPLLDADPMRVSVQGMTQPKPGRGRSLVVTVTEPVTDAD